MKLSKLSLIFSAMLLVVVCINGGVSFLVMQAFNRAQFVQDHRLEALRVRDRHRRPRDRPGHGPHQPPSPPEIPRLASRHA